MHVSVTNQTMFDIQLTSFCSHSVSTLCGIAALAEFTDGPSIMLASIDLRELTERLGQRLVNYCKSSVLLRGNNCFAVSILNGL